MKYVCLHTHSLSPQIRVCTLSHGFVAHTQAPKHIQEHILRPMECTHKTHPCTLTYILMKVLVWEIPFQETKIIVKRKKQSMGNCTNRCKRIPTHILWVLSIRVPTTTTAIAAQHVLGMLPLSANIWWTSQRFQAYISLATHQTDLFQVSPSSLTDHNENCPLAPGAAPSKTLPQTFFSF